jgi:hypothetical protein
MEVFMKAPTKAPAKKATAKSSKVTIYGVGNPLAANALLADMQAHRRQVTATPDTARDFLMRLGVLTPSGKLKQLIRA